MPWLEWNFSSVLSVLHCKVILATYFKSDGSYQLQHPAVTVGNPIPLSYGSLVA